MTRVRCELSQIFNKTKIKDFLLTHELMFASSALAQRRTFAVFKADSDSICPTGKKAGGVIIFVLKRSSVEQGKHNYRMKRPIHAVLFSRTSILKPTDALASRSYLIFDFSDISGNNEAMFAKGFMPTGNEQLENSLKRSTVARFFSSTRL